ncbi:hypothetical protein J4410_03660 [Candidatus Woesearchaeota archaeon]|nr:hypothetical protein [Candidatus Woesearchaeota archaeon]
MKQKLLFLKEDAKESWNCLRSEKKKFFLAFVLDLLFVISLFFLIAQYTPSLYENTNNLLSVMEGIGIEEQITPEVMNQLFLANQAAQAYYNTILKVFATMLFFGLIFYIILEGIAWYTMHLAERGCSLNKKSFGKFLARFAIISAVQLILFLFFLVLFSQTKTVTVGNVTLLSKEGSTSFVTTVFILLGLLVDYLCVYSYSFLVTKNWVRNIFKKPFEHFSYLFLLYLVFAIVAIVFTKIIFMDWNTLISLAFALLIVIPTYTYFRILIYKATRRVSE